MPIDASFIDELKKLALMSRRRVSSIYAGTKRSIRQGKGIEVVDHREYFPGDDPETVDWKIYARTEKLYIKRYEEEKNLALHILIDSSSSMGFNLSGMMKFDYAGSLAAGFAYLAVQENEKFAISLFGERLRAVLPLARGKTHFFKAINVLNSTELKGGTDLPACMQEYKKLIRSKAYVVLFSDFLEPLPQIEEGIYRIAKSSAELLLVHVLDPSEVNLSWNDDIIFEDVEEHAEERSFLSPHFKEDYHRSLLEHTYAIREVCDRLGVAFYTVTTDQPIFPTFVSLINREMENATLPST
jgi:uncharacterized protein (DUF58 family)